MKGTGGISDHFGEILDVVEKDTGAVVIYRERIYPVHLAALEGYDPDGALEP